MLRLWPEQLTAGLFPGHCWLRRRGQETVHAAANEDVPHVLTAALETLFAQAAPTRGAVLDLIVGDGPARIASLPWQARLQSKQEWQAYALATFDAAGTPLDGSWVCTPAMQRYGELGLAVALPSDWLQALEHTARLHGVRLRSVVPLSLAAYRAPRQGRAKGQRWLLLQEERRAALWCFDGGRSIAYDTQPVAGPQGLRQLLQRRLLVAEPAHIAVWRVGSAPDMQPLAAMAPGVPADVLPADYWDRHA